MSRFKSIKTSAQPRLESHEESMHHQIWSKYRPVAEEQYFGKISEISFSDGAPYDMAVCTSTRVHIYDTMTFAVKKTVTRFQSPVNCAHIRDDNQSLIAGSDDGLVQLFDLGSRSILRSFTQHKAAVYSSKFIGDGTRVLTASQDKTAKIFDISTDTMLYDIASHQDSVRHAIQSTLSPDVIITASYDHKVHFHDLRSDTWNTPILTFDHGAPVTSLVMTPGAGTICTAGDDSVRVWNIFDQTACQAQFSGQHQKEITSLCLNRNGENLLSGSLDGTVKIYELSSLKPIYTTYVGQPILSLAMSPDQHTIGVGTPQGLLKVLRRRTALKDKIESEKKLESQRVKKQITPKVVAKLSARGKHFFQGLGYQGTADDHIVKLERAQYLRPFESKLKMFQYGPALDEVIKANDPSTVAALVEELALRNGLGQALQNRDDTSIEPILRFVVKNITSSVYTPSMVILANALLDTHASIIGNSALLDNLFMKLTKRLENELQVQNQYRKLLGELQLVLASSTPQ